MGESEQREGDTIYFPHLEKLLTENNSFLEDLEARLQFDCRVCEDLLLPASCKFRTIDTKHLFNLLCTRQTPPSQSVKSVLSTLNLNELLSSLYLPDERKNSEDDEPTIVRNLREYPPSSEIIEGFSMIQKSFPKLEREVRILCPAAADFMKNLKEDARTYNDGFRIHLPQFHDEFWKRFEDLQRQRKKFEEEADFSLERFRMKGDERSFKPVEQGLFKRVQGRINWALLRDLELTRTIPSAVLALALRIFHAFLDIRNFKVPIMVKN